MNVIRAAQVTAVFFTGLFAGLMFTFWLVIQRMLVTLPAGEYTRIMQELIRGADDPPIVPMIVMIGLIAPIVVLVKLRAARHSAVYRLTLLGWMVFLLGVFVVTVGFNAPINNTIARWSSQSPPSDWMQTRDVWNNLNLIRTPAALLAFGLHALGLCYPLPHQGKQEVTSS